MKEADIQHIQDRMPSTTLVWQSAELSGLDVCAMLYLSFKHDK